MRDKEDPGFAKRMRVAGSDRTDLEKMEKLGLNRLDTGEGPDVFDDVFKNHSIDIRTGELLGRYIAEERDSARMLRCCYEQLKARAGQRGATSRSDQLESLEAKVDALCRAVEDLRQIVCAQAVPASAS